MGFLLFMGSLARTLQPAIVSTTILAQRLSREIVQVPYPRLQIDGFGVYQDLARNRSLCQAVRCKVR